MFQVELFVRNLASSVVFYRCLLGKGCTSCNKTSALFEDARGAVLRLTDESVLNSNHYFNSMRDSAKGKGVELILPVENVDQVFNKLLRIYPAQIESQLADRSWGKRDFRVIDPDGYYVRVSS
ncbi:Glyoxalase-like domain-containing protein [Terribacillus aidingensis]|uniref:Glyoxalase-like domain-containing protein n=1 Tax=Terribacillus aidingensis TaxID=586416 RepID=A0A285P1Q4_9BACI|nr:VOC family protein [Terribacillus aidingensis]SNZ15659.1 Glyoxalase-like domain-containing protein [Terribacillus aidingensis]